MGTDLVAVSADTTAEELDVGSPEWHSLHHTGQGQHHECDYDVCVEWSMRQTLKTATR